MSTNNILKIESLTKCFNTKDGHVINGVSLNIAPYSVTSFLGESGSGKTTLARLIAGLEVPNSGTIYLANRVIVSNTEFIEPQHRGVGMVFQDYALFPHMTVFNNIGYGIQNNNKKEERILEVLNLVGLQELKNRFPHQLSGGQQQRIALARALAPNPQLLLLDEPFSNLDASLKRNLRSELFEIIRKSKVTAIFLTHDIQDAMAVSDTIVVLKGGNIIQKGTAKYLYNKPINNYIASLFSAIVKLDVEDLSFFNYVAKSNVMYAIRQDRFTLGHRKQPYFLQVKIISSSFLGNHYLNKAILPNKKIISFISDNELSEHSILSFRENDLLTFVK